ncbi:MAG: DUF111 family protein, partial [Planctomycetota bacterium]|nr:DUF111 family protein [Planctomycetota bacterium]
MAEAGRELFIDRVVKRRYLLIMNRKSQMKLAYIEPIGGASGDMLLGALVDAGGDTAVIASAAQSV